MPISHEELKRLLHYDPETGVWTRIAPGHGIRVGARADTKTDRRYRKVRVTVAGKKYIFYAHRLAWFYMTGEWAPEVGHWEDDSNRWSNLRSATRQQNLRNARLGRRNTSGFKGVSRSYNNLWESYITIDSKKVGLGYFESAYEAHLMYRRAAKHYFGEFARAQ